MRACMRKHFEKKLRVYQYRIEESMKIVEIELGHKMGEQDKKLIEDQRKRIACFKALVKQIELTLKEADDDKLQGP